MVQLSKPLILVKMNPKQSESMQNTITSNGTGGGNWTAGATWAGGEVLSAILSNSVVATNLVAFFRGTIT